MRHSIALLACLASTCTIRPAFAEDTPAMVRAQAQGFSTALLVTDDPDWEVKWNTPTPGVEFRGTNTVAVGGKIVVLAFLSNPALDAKGNADVKCDMKVTRGDGTVGHDEHDLPCWHGPLPGPRDNIYLAAPRLEVIAEDSDPRGTWRVEMTMRDMVRGVSVPLSTTFTLTDAPPVNAPPANGAKPANAKPAKD